MTDSPTTPPISSFATGATTRMARSTLRGPDSRERCAWVGTDELYHTYHDTEWGTPVRGEQQLFERVALETFQSGLSWITILRRREAFREAFAGFAPDRVAEFGAHDVERLLADTRIIRNRRKIESTIGNARALRAWHQDDPSALTNLIWSYAPPAGRPRPRHLDQVPATSDASHELSRELKRRGFRFVGPTTMYALLQATGVVDDHVVGCWRGGE